MGQISGFDFPNYVSVPIEIFENSDLISIEANITSPEIIEVSLDETVPIVQLEDDKAKLQLQNLNITLQADYAYVSDPPLFADIGEATILLEGLTISVEVNTDLAQTSEG